MELNEQQQSALAQAHADALVGRPGELRATIHIKRAATGLVETYQLTGHMAGATPGGQNGSDPLDGGS